MIEIKKVKNTKTNLLCKFVFVFFTFLFIPTIVNAQIVITEIMYDLETGLDSGREWVEICNNGNENIDLIGGRSGWRLFEGETNHTLNSEYETGDFIVSSGTCAVIADNIEKFRQDWTSYSGIIFDSSFSLSNTGEILVMKNSDLIEIDSVTYNSELGANGDGKSLQLVNGNWISESPTPGEINSGGEISQVEQQETIIDVSEEKAQINTTSVAKSQIFADAGNNRNVIVGADSLFEARAWGLEGSFLKNARYIWNFGDGNIQEGRSVMHNYQYPSDYVVILNVASGEYSVSDKILIKALPANIVVSSVNEESGSVELQNSSDNELDLSWWRIRSGRDFFTIPKNTIILPNTKVILSQRTSGLSFDDLSQIYLLYPNGKVAYYFDPSVLQVSETTSIIPQKTIISEPISVYQKSEKVIEQEDVGETLGHIGQTASVVGATDNNLLNKWTFLLGGLILISIGSVLFLKKVDENNEKVNNKLNEEKIDDELSVDDFKIIK